MRSIFHLTITYFTPELFFYTNRKNNLRNVKKKSISASEKSSWGKLIYFCPSILQVYCTTVWVIYLQTGSSLVTWLAGCCGGRRRARETPGVLVA